MAVSHLPGSFSQHIVESDSDYGSDIDETAADDIFSQIDSQQAILPQTPRQGITEPSTNDEPTTPDGLEERLAQISKDFAQGVRGIAKALVDFGGAISDISPQQTPRAPTRTRRSTSSNLSTVKQEDATPMFEPPVPEVGKEVEPNDTRSPLERFRLRPQKAMIVTDFAGPAWCELQYWFGLTKGKAPRTAAMEEGSAVHKTLEEQVHVEIPIKTVTREDRFGLRLWNIISSLRTLRKTSMTREMEVWGIVEGQVVNGKIDEITTICPNEEFEARMDDEKDAKETKHSAAKSSSLPAGQRTLTDFLTSSRGGAILESGDTAWLGHLHQRPRTIYLKDAKTRKHPSVPTDQAGLRPVQIQLTLYHYLFSSLSANAVPAEKIFERYSVDPAVQFTDTFIAQIAQMGTQSDSSSPNAGRDYDYYVNRNGDDEPAFPSLSQSLEEHDSFDEIMSHNNLSSLWGLMMEEFALLAPDEARAEGETAPVISPMLTVDYYFGRRGSYIGNLSFPYTQADFEKYVREGMSWWKGERPPKGVELEEAHKKCGQCHFAEECDWRKNKLDIDLARIKSKGRRAVSFSPAAI